MIKDFKAVKISIASPEQILNWSHGEVKEAETINYRTHRAEVDGLMDEKIFGPTKNYECYCGKYKKIRYKGIICDKCGVEVTNKRVRRERMGHIKLATPVVHIWFAYGVPNKLSLILGIPQKKLETVIYFARYIVTSFDADKKKASLEAIDQMLKDELDQFKKERDEALVEVENKYKETANKVKKSKEKKGAIDLQLEKLKNDEKKEIAKTKSIFSQKEEKLKVKYSEVTKLAESITEGTTISEEDYNKLMEMSAEFFEAGMGAEAIKQLLAKLDIDKMIADLKEEKTKTRSVMRQRKIIQRLRILEGLKINHTEPGWIVLANLPVLPPDLRPIIQLPGGRFATSDLNDLYRRVINRNNRLKRLMNLGAPEIILRNEKRMLQEAVDALIDNSHRPGNAVLNSRGQAYKSLSDMLRGKQGRFRQNLLGKRVDYSGRSVIVVGPHLSIYQCGLPKTMALELFKPFIIREIISDGLAPNIKSAKHFYESKSGEVWDILERVIQDRPVLLNRAPTLHKQGIQAFFPVLIEGNAIQLHPMMCKGFNADFDGDQMAVHVPLSKLAIQETLDRMFANSNILRLADGSPVINIEKDMALGVYYMTTTLENEPEKVFATANEAFGAFLNEDIDLREQVKVMIKGELLTTTVGRISFNEAFPTEFGFINKPVDKKGFAKLSAKVLNDYGSDAVIELLNKIEPSSLKYATLSGYSVGMEDFVVSKSKDVLLEGIEKVEAQLTEDYYMGLLSVDERKRLSNEAWMELVDKVSEETWKEYEGKNNPLTFFNASGALPLENPIRQISGVRGLILDPLGRIVELPLRSNYRQGLPTMEYFVAARGTRKGLADTALKTAESGYLTRKLVDVAQGVITREVDCGTDYGIVLKKSSDRRMDFNERLAGRYTLEDIADPKTGEVIVKDGDLITDDFAEKINELDIPQVHVRSVIGCKTMEGVCQKCYGYSLGTKRLVDLGVAVGVIAAQSMGEAATQLTLNTKHLAGRAGTDITQGLPRVEELFEVRMPKGKATIASVDGKIKITKDKESGKILITISDQKTLQKTFQIEKGDKSMIKRSKKVKKGDLLIERKSGNVESPVEGQAEIKDDMIIITIDKKIEEQYEIEPESQILIEDGSNVIAGTALTAGSIDPKELLEFATLESAQQYLIDNIQSTYGIQGIALDDKHVEIVVRQMSRFVKITSSMDSDILPGDFVDFLKVEAENQRLKDKGVKPIKFQRVVLGVTTASVRTESFLSAASFQEQVRVLSEAALLGKVDELIGLKENVIIGRPVPLGDEFHLKETK